MERMLDGLLDAVRTAAGDRVWGAAVKLARGGAVQGISDDGDEVHLTVKAAGKQVWHEVYLWPGEPDWGCDCNLPQPCVHVAAATIALGQSRSKGESLPQPEVQHRVHVRYEFTSKGDGLEVRRIAVFADGSTEVLKRALAELDLVAARPDVQAEVLLTMHPGGELPPETLRRLLTVLEASSELWVDGVRVALDPEPVMFRVRVTDDGAGGGFKVALVRPTGISRLFRGAALVTDPNGSTLRPTSHGELTTEQRRMLIKGVTYSPEEVGALVSEVLPKLRERIPVDVQTDRMPKADALVPCVMVALEERPGGLEVQSQIVYGDPPVARITPAGTLAILSDTVVPARDPAGERTVAREFQERTGLTVGFTRLLPPSEAAGFLQTRLPNHTGPVRGRVDPNRFEVRDVMLSPKIDVRDVGGEWALEVSFGDGRHEADTKTLLEAWRGGKPLVPLMDGGYAPLPTHWLAEHGALLQELLEARSAAGRVQRNSTAALIELLEDTRAEVPPDLARLRRFLEGGEGLPEVLIPPGLQADLRPYQRAGMQWMSFLRAMDLHGVLADDMGLGKTVQALAGMLDAGGRHLVVAPTSVLTNWQREANRFAPQLKVNLYHGTDRELDPKADITLTSYALLRMDIDRLRATEWSYAVLDEAQAIKNPHSLTARSAFALRARHRMVLTGTPVENRLEELWSLFRYLMPGLLGSEAAFRDRFSKPIEAGDAKARDALRARVRPYVLRRLKQQVETELPPLTEIVESVPLEGKQREVYEAVRMAARKDVQELLSKGNSATIQVLEALLRMRQACCDPTLLPGDVGAGIGAAKLDRMEEILVEVVSEGHKVLVFSQWTSLLDRVEPRLGSLGVDFVRLDGTTRDRQAVIDRFQSADGPPVFLLSLKAGGFGLNLTAADYVIHLDPWWNPAVERQATDRAHRIGQDRPVVSYKLVAESTVEERILELQAAKRELADAALGTEGGFLRALTAEELRSLFDAA
jgi:superfamily II DNA or RNA helicase